MIYILKHSNGEFIKAITRQDSKFPSEEAKNAILSDYYHRTRSEKDICVVEIREGDQKSHKFAIPGNPNNAILQVGELHNTWIENTHSYFLTVL